MEGAGLHLARTEPQTQTLLRSVMVPDAQVAGPVDLLGGADEVGYRKALDILLADPGVRRRAGDPGAAGAGELEGCGQGVRRPPARRKKGHASLFWPV